jgi:hypothetical protein
VRLIEPTFSNRDRFLWATDHGRVVLVESESISLSKDDLGPKPELISLSLFCRAIRSTVSVSRVVGDTKEFPAEIKRLAEGAAADLLLLPWRSSQYNERIMWSTVFRASAPLALLVDISEEEKDGKDVRAQSVRSVIVLVRFEPTDVLLLQLAAKLLGSRGVSVTVVVPAVVPPSCSALLRDLIGNLETYEHDSLVVKRTEFMHTSLDGYFSECSRDVFDLILVSFTDPAGDLGGISPVPSQNDPRDRSRSRAGTLSAMVEVLTSAEPDLFDFRRSLGIPESIISSGAEHPELGLLVERLRTARLAQYILVLHPTRDPSFPRRESVDMGTPAGVITKRGPSPIRAPVDTPPLSLATIKEIDVQEDVISAEEDTMGDAIRDA